MVKHIGEAERARVPGRHELAEAAARYYFKLLAIKDEYEVARLYSDGSFAKQIGAAFEGNPHLEFHLAPPFLGRKNAKGEASQIEFRAVDHAGFPFARRAERAARNAFRCFRLIRRNAATSGN